MNNLSGLTFGLLAVENETQHGHSSTHVSVLDQSRVGRLILLVPSSRKQKQTNVSRNTELKLFKSCNVANKLTINSGIHVVVVQM